MIGENVCIHKTRLLLIYNTEKVYVCPKGFNLENIFKNLLMKKEISN